MRRFWICVWLVVFGLVGCSTSTLPTEQPGATTVSQPVQPTPTSRPTATLVPIVEPTEPLPTDIPATEVVATQPAAANAGLIFYLDADGTTIRTINPDGSNQQTLINIGRDADQVFNGMTATADGRYLIYGIDGLYYLVEGGQAEAVGTFTDLPQLSPLGDRFVAQSFGTQDADNQIYLYDLAGRAGTLLPAQGQPTWFPDGTQVLYVHDSNIFVYDLISGAITQLTDLPSTGDDPWYVQVAFVTPDGESIVFYAGQRSQVGASGNGMHWWIMPAIGGEFRSLTEPNGNGVTGVTFNPGGYVMAYAESAHVSACSSIQDVIVQTLSEGGVLHDQSLNYLILKVEESRLVSGVSWSPDGGQLAFGAQTYRCTPEFEQAFEPTQIYLWNISTGATPQPLLEGSYPVWVRSP